MTKREMFLAIRELVSTNDEMVNFIDHEIELLNRKTSAKKPTKTQVENEKLKTDIVMALANADKPLCIKELQEVVPTIAELSNQRVSHLLKALKDENQIEKTYVKKVPFFSIA